jgi:hypothetical protein
VDSDELEGLPVAIMHVRQGRVESPTEHVVEPQILNMNARSSENFIHTGHEPEGAIVNVPPERTRKLHCFGARFLPHSFDRRQRFFTELMGERQHAAGDLGLAEDRHDLRGNPVPLGQASSRGALEHRHRLTAAHQITRQEAHAAYDIADLVEAHAGAPQRLDVGASPALSFQPRRFKWSSATLRPTRPAETRSSKTHPQSVDIQ